MKRRDLLYATGAVSLGSTIAGCITGGDSDTTDQPENSTSGTASKPTLQKVLVNNDADEPKRIGIEVVQNHENRVHTGYSELEPSNSHALDREWPPEPGAFSIVLHVPDDDQYDLVTFSTLDDHHDWDEDVKVVYEIRTDGEIDDSVVELSSDS